ncbi:MAG: PAS domain-containing protein [Actinomycetota bacterium]
MTARSFSLLMVEDNPDDRILVMRALKKEFAHLDVTAIGEQDEFETALNDWNFDVVVTDFAIGWTDGLEVLRRVKELDADCPVIMFSGTSGEETAVAAMKAGVDDFVLKSPDHITHLTVAVNSALDKRERHRAAGAAERALRASELRFRTLSLEAPVGIFETDADGQCIFTNKKWNELSGISTEDALGDGWAKALHPDDRDRVFEQWTRALEEVGEFKAEYRFRTPDGVVSWLSGQAAPLLSGSGVLTGYIGTITDITERRETEERLRQAEREYRSLVEGSPAIVYRAPYEPDPKISYVSPQIEMLGVSMEEFAADPDANWRNMVHPDDRVRERAAADHAKETGEKFDEEYRVITPQGKTLWVHDFAEVVRNGDGEPLHWQGIVLDVSPAKEAEAQLREAEERYRSLVERIPAVTYIEVADPSSPFGYRDTYVSPQVGAILGLTAKEWMEDPTRFRNMIHADDREWVLELADPATETGDSYKIEYRMIVGSGKTKWVREEAYLLRDEEGAPVHWQGIITDITEERRVGEAKLAREAAEHANRAKSEFLSRMSHELRTPMNAVLGFAQLLGLEELPADQQESVDQILKAGRHLLNLIDEVLDISRIEAGSMTLSLEPVSVWEVVRESTELIQPQASEAGIQLADNDPGECNAMADRQRLKQVVINLLSNGIKYNRKNGKVEVECTNREDGRVEITVADTGPGIPGALIDAIFAPFERLGAEATAIEGTGLGLSLSRTLIEAMGGTLEVESIVDVGSKFKILLPQAEARTEPDGDEPTQATLPSAGAETHTILYIEDNLSNLKLVERILGRRPEVKLISAMQGRLGLELARKHHPDLILLDVHLPDLPGDEILRYLSATPELRAIPVIMLTADASPTHAAALKAQGATDYLTKPLDIQRFLDVIDSI